MEILFLIGLTCLVLLALASWVDPYHPNHYHLPDYPYEDAPTEEMER